MNVHKFKFFVDDKGAWWYQEVEPFKATWKFGPFSSQERAEEAAKFQCIHMGWQFEIV